MRLRPSFLLYGATAALSVLILAIVTTLWQADWTVPLGPLSQDLFFHAGLIKGMLENGWYFSNSHLGAPGQLNLLDFPYGPNLHMALIKGLSLFSGNYATLFNIYFVLTFPLTALAALFSLRRFGVGAAPAMLASLLFALLPYHFMRGENHIFYSAYFMVPLLAMVALWLCRGELVWGTRRFLAAAGICSLAAFDLPYYSYFAIFFCAVGGIYSALRAVEQFPCPLSPVPRPLLRHLAAAGLLIGAILACSVLNEAPSLLYKWKNGVNSQVAERGAAESEVFALKIVQLVLPLTEHRLPAFAQLKQRYNQNAPLVNENDTATLGIIGSIGFCLLLAAPLARKLSELSLLNLTAVLVGTMGGIGSIIAFTLVPMVRSYNRVSVYIAFFSFFAVALSIDYAARRFAAVRLLQWPIVGVLLIFGIWDQTSPRFVPPHREIRDEFASDRAFIGGIERMLPAGSMVFQLPYLSFPEGLPENPPDILMRDYSHIRGYLNSRTLRWSYGAMRGRPIDEWQQEVSAKPPLEMARALVIRGFNGIYVDRFGYPDQGKGTLAGLSQLLGPPVLESGNKRLVFFDLRPFEAKWRAEMPAEQWRQMQTEARDRITLTWAPPGFHRLEKDPHKEWRWCAAKGTLIVDNPTQRTRRLEFTTRFSIGQAGDANLWIKGLISDHIKISARGVPYSRAFDVPPGVHQIHFSCDAKRVEAPGDLRVLVFVMENFQCHEIFPKEPGDRSQESE